MNFKTTIDPDSLAKGGPENAGAPPLAPFVEVLFHPDLERVGLKTSPGLSMSEVVVLGRGAPDFWAPSLSGAEVARSGTPLEDPCLSRRTLAITWLDKEGAFLLEPMAQNRTVRLWTREAMSNIGEPLPEPLVLRGPYRAVPGAMVGIDRRHLLLLGHQQRRDPRADRLEMLGESAGLWRVRDDVEAVARLHRPALVQGETGVGKELVSRAIHALSDRRRGPFRVVNCGAIPEHLVESTLFGHKKGAFTGASEAAEGLFRAAHGGTLFLDEIGELPLAVQQKLLRVLQLGTIMPVGFTREVAVDVRVIAATHRDLQSECEAKRFREDLYHRLAVHIVDVPPLRQRREDIPRLFVNFLKERARRYPELQRLFVPVGASQPPIPQSFFLDLMGGPWRGNVRQLQNTVEKLVQFNLKPGPFVPPPIELASATAAKDTPRAAPTPTPSSSSPLLDQGLESLGITRATATRLIGQSEFAKLDQTLAVRRERSLDELRETLTQGLQRCLETYDYNQTRTASALGIARSTLIRMMDNLDFIRPKELPPETIQAALSASGGSTVEAARALRVSHRGLRLRMKELQMTIDT